MEIELITIYLLLGLLGGFLSGLLGVGGGIIFIPVFQYIFISHGVEGEELVRYILANSFFAILFAGISSSSKHIRMGNFDAKEVFSIAIPATVFGTVLSLWITHSAWYKEEYFKMVFIGVILFTLWRTWTNRNKENPSGERPFSFLVSGSIGVATGLISAVSGLGGGVAMIPLLTMVAKKDIKKASAISISVIPIMVLPFLVIYASGTPINQFPYGLGYLQFLFSLPVIVGIFIGSPIGVRVGQGMKSRTLQLIFAALLVVIVTRYIIQLM